MADVRTRPQTAFNLLDLGGRAGRLEMAVLFVAWAIWLIVRQTLVAPGEWAIIIAVGFTLSFALLFASARRLHDLDRSGWWALVGFVPFLNFALFLALSVLPGKPESNRFGPPPGSPRA